MQRACLSILKVSVILGIAFWMQPSTSYAGTKATGSFDYTLENTCFTSEQGLSNSRVNCIIQDSYGYMWFGSDYGLNKYDGNNFTIFTKGIHDSLTPPGNAIQRICEARDGRLWLVSNGSKVSYMDRSTGVFRQVMVEQPVDTSRQGVFITAMYATRDGSVWFGSRLGFIFHCAPGDSVIRHRQSIGRHQNRDVVRCFFQDSDGRLWLGTGIGLSMYNTESQAFEQWCDWSDTGAKDAEAIVNVVLHQDKDDRLWVSYGLELGMINVEEKSLTPVISLPYSYEFWQLYAFFYLTSDNLGRLWLGSLRGLFLYDPSIDTLICLNDKLQGINNKQKLKIQAMCKDRSGNIWVGTNNNGLIKIPPPGSVFPHLGYAPESSLEQKQIRALLIDNKQVLWIGTGRGLYSSSAPPYDTFKHHAEIHPIDQPDAAVNTLALDSTGHLWIGYSAREWHRYHVPTGRLDRFKTTNASDAAGVFSICTDAAGEVFLGAKCGLQWYRRDRDTTLLFKIQEHEHVPVNDRVIFDIHEDRTGTLWVGTNLGLYIFDRKSAAFTREFVHQWRDSTSISSSEVTCIFEDSRENLWFGTNGAGINRFDRENETFEHFSEQEGLAHNMVFGILEDEQGRLWISTSGGLCRFDTRNNTFRTYDSGEGIQHKEFFFGAHHRNRHTGELLFGGINGFNIFRPDSIQGNPHIPTVAISRFKVFNSLRYEELHNGDTVRLHYDSSFFSFEIAALDFRNPGRNTYRHLLENYDPDTVEAGTRHFVQYTSVPPGEYTLWVNGCNNDGVWHPQGSKITIIVATPFWQTAPFRAALFAFLLLILIAAFRWRIRIVQKREALRRKHLETELQSLRLQLNPHFIFNSLTSIQDLVLKQDAEAASDVLSRFAQLMRRLLEHSRRKTISLAEELETLEHYLELQALRFDNDLHWDMYVEPGIDIWCLTVPALVLQPYVENSLVHGLSHKTHDRRLRISVCLREDSVICCIEDNGIGRERAARFSRRRHGSSIGMHASRERLSLLSEQQLKQYRVRVVDLYSEKREPRGTRVEISLPVQFLPQAEIYAA